MPLQVPWSPLPSLSLQLRGALVSRRCPVRAARPRQVPQRHRGLSKCHCVLVVGCLSSAWKGEDLFSTLEKKYEPTFISSNDWLMLMSMFCCDERVENFRKGLNLGTRIIDQPLTLCFCSSIRLWM